MRSILLLFLMLMAGESFARLPDLIPYRKGELWGYCDSTKKIVIEPQWEYATVFSCGRAIVEDHELYGIINEKGEYTLRPKYKSLGLRGCNRYEVYTDKNHCGLIDDTGKVIISFICRWIIQETDSVYTVNIKGDSWIYDRDGQLILPVAFTGWDMGVGGAITDGGCVKYGLFIVEPLRKKKFIVLDRFNHQFIPGAYDWINFLNDSLFECQVGDSTAYYNLRGEFIPDYWPPVPDRTRKLFADRDHDESALIRVTNQVCIRQTYYKQIFVGYTDYYGTEYWED